MSGLSASRSRSRLLHCIGIHFGLPNWWNGSATCSCTATTHWAIAFLGTSAFATNFLTDVFSKLKGNSKSPVLIFTSLEDLSCSPPASKQWTVSDMTCQLHAGPFQPPAWPSGTQEPESDCLLYHVVMHHQGLTGLVTSDPAWQLTWGYRWNITVWTAKRSKLICFTLLLHCTAQHPAMKHGQLHAKWDVLPAGAKQERTNCCRNEGSNHAIQRAASRGSWLTRQPSGQFAGKSLTKVFLAQASQCSRSMWLASF